MKMRTRDSVRSLNPFQVNLLVGWWGILAGLAAALWLGIWAFGGPGHPPSGWEAYDALPRRLFRLGHIAAVAVGVLNILLARELPLLELPAAWKTAASRLAVAAWFGLAVGCVATAFAPALGVVLPLGALSLTAAVGIAAVGAVRKTEGRI